MKVISRGGSKLISTLKAIGAELIKLIDRPMYDPRDEIEKLRLKKLTIAANI